MTKEYTDTQMEAVIEIGGMVFGEAERIYRALGIEYDFCVQYVGGCTVVFGGTTRVLWHVGAGFTFDRDFSTAEIRQKAVLLGLLVT